MKKERVGSAKRVVSSGRAGRRGGPQSEYQGKGVLQREQIPSSEISSQLCKLTVQQARVEENSSAPLACPSWTCTGRACTFDTTRQDGQTSNVVESESHVAGLRQEAAIQDKRHVLQTYGARPWYGDVELSVQQSKISGSTDLQLP
jgi:hypothetical protein